MAQLCGSRNPDNQDVVCYRNRGHDGDHHVDCEGACLLWTDEIDIIRDMRNLT